MVVYAWVDSSSSTAVIIIINVGQRNVRLTYQRQTSPALFRFLPLLNYYLYLCSTDGSELVTSGYGPHSQNVYRVFHHTHLCMCVCVLVKMFVYSSCVLLHVHLNILMRLFNYSGVFFSSFTYKDNYVSLSCFVFMKRKHFRLRKSLSVECLLAVVRENETEKYISAPTRRIYRIHWLIGFLHGNMHLHLNPK